jgi:ATP-GRASP peptide maturase of grasp-with-spasm system
MILILSKEQGESATEEVMDWLSYFGCDFQRLNGNNLRTKPFKITLGESNNCILNNYNEFILQDEISLIWNRRWRDSNFLDKTEQKVNKNFLYEMKTHLLNEFSRVSQYIYHIFSQKEWVDKPSLIQPNKLIVLEAAKNCGLEIPNTLITNNKEDALCFLSENKRVCTKPIHEVSTFFNYKQQSAYLMDTKEVKEADLLTMESIFFPSLFQKLIEKRFDIRIFYLKETFYAMAIFSQRRRQSALDFRNYNFIDPDRTIPFILPNHIQDNLYKLVTQLGYQHCSIDMIKDVNNDYYFLEINPVGQFGMVSKPCNYHLEMKLALYLKEKHDEK